MPWCFGALCACWAWPCSAPAPAPSPAPPASRRPADQATRPSPTPLPIHNRRESASMPRGAPGRRDQTRAEEMANAISHSLGLAAALAAGLFLLATAAQRGGAAFSLGAGGYVASGVALVLAPRAFP